MSFRSDLIAKYNTLVEKSFTHKLTKEICNGLLPDFKLYTYLSQDQKFFQKGMNVFGKTLAYCANPESAIVLAKQIGFVANDENDYFTIALEQTAANAEKHVPKMTTGKVILSKVQEYLDYLDYITYESKSYLEIITFMYVMEFVYLGWADLNLGKGVIPKDLEYKYLEWINLHSGKDFTRWVKFLESELDRAILEVKDDEELKLCETTFVNVLQLEVDFFDECYNYKES